MTPTMTGGCRRRTVLLVVRLDTQEAARLPGPQRGVDTATREQGCVGTLLDDASRVEDDDPVHPRDRREPVRDRDDRPTCITWSSVSWIAASTSESNAEVASSRMRMGASL